MNETIGADHAVTERMHSDLLALARWRLIRGRGDEPVLHVEIEDGSPEETQEAAARLNTVTARDLLPEIEISDPVDELAAVIAGLDERQSSLLRDRHLADKPVTLDELGARYGVTRERIRQIEKKLKDHLATAFGPDTSVSAFLAAMRVEIQPIAPLERLRERMPELDRAVPGTDKPLWFVLDKLDDAFEVVDGWAAAPDIRSAKARTLTTLDDLVDDHGVVELTAVAAVLTLPAPELEAWLSWCGVALADGWALTRTRSMDDHAAAVLAIAGEPLGLEEIASRTGRDLNIRSLANRLNEDDRFVRTDKAAWALAGWGHEQYSGIRAEIARVLQKAGGEIELQTLVDDLCARFDVSPNSVQTYASSGEYELRAGVVRRRATRALPRKRPEDTKRLYRIGKTWCFRVVVNHDHLRGAGLSVPNGVATVAGCVPGETITLESRLGPQAVRWTGTQPGLATIRRFLEDLGSAEGDTVFLRFGPNSDFDVLPTPAPGSDPISGVLRLVGAGAVDGDATPILAEAAGLDGGAKPRRILSAFRRRGDEEIVALLEEAWVRVPAGG
ncbi:sigma factor-like helix-turn-helix DNA-binding protein [Pseudonocardia sp. CA-142604]|uniref:sigma factor-like helix-turn-helix DNA-binding protein n=1 Tax=Pseudonocardia sp. CA-142604 TaxID=3240024 RepID=UPI003D928BAE